MAPPKFLWPTPDPGDDLGLVALDYELTAERLISAYRHGIFPWPDSEPCTPVPWVCPRRRAILEFESLRIPRSLKKSVRAQADLRFTIDADFAAVIEACSTAPRRGQRGTWITRPMIAAYIEVHRRGFAHSVEAWAGEDLMGGLYGVTAGGVFTGESMFHRRNDISKLCILFLIDHLRARGATWIDIQQLTPHFALMGAREISRDEFLVRLSTEQKHQRKLFP
jgi:leucyl/phenylalanyl-tRNA---protein transferase